jgi:hypothetical protein
MDAYSMRASGRLPANNGGIDSANRDGANPVRIDVGFRESFAAGCATDGF